MSDSPTPENVQPQTERNESGRFLRGNKGGPGNPFARQVGLIHRTLLEAFNQTEVAAVAQALLAKAKNGDVPAAKLLFEYTMGKPAAHVDPDELDYREWQQYLDSHKMFKQMPAMVSYPDASLPLKVVRAARPEVTKGMGNKLADVLRNPEKYQPEIPEMVMVPDDDPASGLAGATPSPSPNGSKRRAKRKAKKARPSPKGKREKLACGFAPADARPNSNFHANRFAVSPSPNGGTVKHGHEAERASAKPQACFSVNRMKDAPSTNGRRPHS